MSTELKEGRKAPAFSLPASSGEKISLANLKGKRVVLYFYPKDMTSGCTREAQEFTALAARFKRKNTLIFGVSPDSIKRHQKFIENEGIKFPLLSDESKKILGKYGVWKEKSMYGRKYMGVERSTFVIDEHGVIQKIYRKVSVPEHAACVLEDIGK